MAFCPDSTKQPLPHQHRAGPLAVRGRLTPCRTEVPRGRNRRPRRCSESRSSRLLRGFSSTIFQEDVGCPISVRPEKHLRLADTRRLRFGSRSHATTFLLANYTCLRVASQVQSLKKPMMLRRSFSVPKTVESFQCLAGKHPRAEPKAISREPLEVA